MVTYSAETSEHSSPEDQPLPPELARGILQSQRDRRVSIQDGTYRLSSAKERPEGLPLAAVPEARAVLRLRIEQNELGRFTFTGGPGSFISETSATPGTWHLTGSAPALGVGMSPAVLDPKNGVANAKLARDPALQRRATVQPRASCRLVPDPGPSTGTPEGEPEPRVTTADVLEALHQETGRPIVADYYTRLFPPAEVSVRNLSLFDALSRLSDRMRLRWSKDGEWLQFRSTSYFSDRLKEVPNRLLARWAESRRQHGALTFDDLVEIAQLSDAQLDASGMAEGARAQFGLREWVHLRRRAIREHLRFLSEFTPDQRRQAQTPAGLLFSRMTLAQQRGYLARAFHDRQNPHLDDLASATLHVDYRLPGWFRWSPPGRWHGYRPSLVRERTREAALQAARRIDPAAEDGQIVPTESDVVFLYTANAQDSPRVVRTREDGWFSDR
jgi:hypothetical protein